MRRLNRVLVVVLVLVGPYFFSVAAGAESDRTEARKKFGTSAVTGQDLLTVCDPEGAWCSGYVMGSVDMHNMLALNGDVTPLFCLPLKVTAAQWRLVTLKYLKAHPEQLHWPGVLLVFAALKDAFPCKEME